MKNITLENKKMLKKSHRLKFRYDEEGGFCTFLPFSLHIGCFDPELDTIRSENEKHRIMKVVSDLHPLYFRQIIKFQINLKYELLFQQLKRLRVQFMQQKACYSHLMSRFIDHNREKINLLRTRTMMQLDQHTFRDITTKEEIINRNYPSRFDDGLPFRSLIFKFAQSMPNAPDPPQLQLKLKNAGALFTEYTSRMGAACAMAENNFLIKKMGVL